MGLYVLYQFDPFFIHIIKYSGISIFIHISTTSMRFLSLLQLIKLFVAYVESLFFLSIIVEIVARNGSNLINKSLCVVRTAFVLVPEKRRGFYFLCSPSFLVWIRPLL